MISAIPVFTFIIYISTQVIHGKVNGVYLAASLMLPALISLFAIRLLIRLNSRRLDRLNDVMKRQSRQ
ncbi:hypothetical protein PMAYCL1PPCAC_27416, partial [Pristionchus mayeri]